MNDPQIIQIALDDLFVDEEFNSRTRISPIDIKDLADRIKEEGLLQPVIVTVATDEEKARTGKTYTLLGGFRRTKACTLNKMTHITATVHQTDDLNKRRIINLQENVVRQELSFIEEAKALEPLFQAGYSEQQVMKELGKKRGWVQTRKMVLHMPQEIQDEVEAGVITQTDVRHLYTTGKNTNFNREELFSHARKIKEVREKGGKQEVRPKPKAGAEVKHQRKRSELVAMQDHVFATCKGNNILTRLLGWANGYVSDKEFNEDFEEWCKTQGNDFKPFETATA